MATIAGAAVAIGAIQFGAGSRDGGTATNDQQSTSAATAGAWTVAPAESAIRFSGEYAGTPFTGRFERWQADIRIDRDDVTASRIAATIKTASAVDGVLLHEKTLPQKEWFDVAIHPEATYRADTIRRQADNRYAVEGTLTIKDKAIDVAPLALTVDGDHATIEGRTEIDRVAADLGMASDPDGSWVSTTIGVDVRVTLNAPS